MTFTPISNQTLPKLIHALTATQPNGCTDSGCPHRRRMPGTLPVIHTPLHAPRTASKQSRARGHRHQAKPSRGHGLQAKPCPWPPPSSQAKPWPRPPSKAVPVATASASRATHYCGHSQWQLCGMLTGARNTWHALRGAGTKAAAQAAVRRPSICQRRLAPASRILHVPKLHVPSMWPLAGGMPLHLSALQGHHDPPRGAGGGVAS